MTRLQGTVGACAVALLPLAGSGDDGLGFTDDYYEGFAQGAYYGLMLAGMDYAVAWCMKAELGEEVQNLGAGADFQHKLEALLAHCRAAENGQGDADGAH